MLLGGFRRPGRLEIKRHTSALIYTDYGTILDGSVRVYTIKKSTDASVVANNDNGLEVNADKTK